MQCLAAAPAEAVITTCTKVREYDGSATLSNARTIIRQPAAAGAIAADARRGIISQALKRSQAMRAAAHLALTDHCRTCSGRITHRVALLSNQKSLEFGSSSHAALQT